MLKPITHDPMQKSLKIQGLLASAKDQFKSSTTSIPFKIDFVTPASVSKATLNAINKKLGKLPHTKTKIEKTIGNLLDVDCSLVTTISWTPNLHTVLFTLYNKKSTATISDCSFIDWQVSLP